MGARWSRVDWEKRTILLDTKVIEYKENGKVMLDDGKEVMADEIFRMAESKNISRRTVNEAKKKIPNIKTRKTRPLSRSQTQLCIAVTCKRCADENDSGLARSL